MTSTLREAASDMEVATVLTEISSSPVRLKERPTIQQSPPATPYFAAYMQEKYSSNPSLSLCDTPVPVLAHLPGQSPFPDATTKNMLSPLPIALFEREGAEALSQLRDTPTSNRKRKPPYKNLLAEDFDETSQGPFAGNKLIFSEPNSPGPSTSQPPLEVHSVDTAPSSSSMRNPASMAIVHGDVGHDSPRQRQAAAATPRVGPSGSLNTPLSQTTSNKRRRLPPRAATSSGKASAQISSQEEDEDYDEDDEDNPNDSDSPKPCKCKRSKCLKLYCDCFGADRYCGKSCTCQDCLNTDKPEHQAARAEAVQQTLERNPNAFTSKILETSESAQHAKGCHCKRSGCLKKYCECFALGVLCTAHCKCSGCLNYSGSQSLSAARAGGSPAVMTSASKSAGMSSSKKKRIGSEIKALPSPRKSARKKSVLQAMNESEEGDAEGKAEQAQMERSRNMNAGDASGYTNQHHVHFLLSSKVPELSHPASFSDLDEMVGEQSMDSVAFYSSQESKGSLSSKRDDRPKRMINWGRRQLSEDLTRRCFEFLDTKSLVDTACVSLGFAEVATSPNMWQYPESSQSTQGSSQ